MMHARSTLFAATLTASTMLVGCRSGDQVTAEQAMHAHGHTHMNIRYMEIVSADVDAQIASMEQGHGLSFGDPIADLGQARVADAGHGMEVGVRAPMAAHEAPIIRTYIAVDDIAAAIAEAEAAGAMVAYGPAQQGDTGTWAIYILGGVQVGLWQK